MSQHDAASPHDRVIVVEAPSVTKALDDVRARTGVEPQVVDVDRVTRGGVGGFFARELVQVKLRIPAANKGAAQGSRAVRPARAKRNQQGLPAAGSTPASAAQPASAPVGEEVEGVRVLDPKEVAREMLAMHAAGKAARTGEPQRVITLDEDEPNRIARPDGNVTDQNGSLLNTEPLPAHLLHNDPPSAAPTPKASSPDVQLRGVDDALQAMLAQQDAQDTAATSTAGTANRPDGAARRSTPPALPRVPGPTINPDSPEVIAAVGLRDDARPWHSEEMSRPGSPSVDDTEPVTGLRERLGGNRFAISREHSDRQAPRRNDAAYDALAPTGPPARDALRQMATTRLDPAETSGLLRGRPASQAAATSDETALDDIREQLGVQHAAGATAAARPPVRNNLAVDTVREAPLATTRTDAPDTKDAPPAAALPAQTIASSPAARETIAQPRKVPDFAARLRAGMGHGSVTDGNVRLTAMSLMGAGIPVDIVRRLGEAKPTSETAWLSALENVLEPLVGENPTGSVAYVGPRAAEMAAMLGIPFVAEGEFPPYAGDVALAASDTPAGRAWVREVVGERAVHLVAGGDAWQGHATGKVAAISWLGTDALAQTLALAIRHDVPVVWAGPDGSPVRRASGVEMAIAVRELAIRSSVRS